MTPLPLLALALRLLGIYGVFKGIQMLLSSFAALEMVTLDSAGFPDRWHLYYAVLFGAYFVLVLSLIAWPAALARALMPDMPPSSQASAIAPVAGEFQVAAYAILGVGLIALALPSLAYNTVFLWQDQRGFAGTSRVSIRAMLIYDVLRIAVGLLLCLQGRGIVRLLQRLRY